MRGAGSSHRLGIAAMLIAIAGFCAMDACMKLLSPRYPPMQVAALRGLTSLPLIFAWSVVHGGVAQLWRVRWPLHLLRGVLAVVMLGTFAFALRDLPLAEAYSLFFIAPLLITALAVPLLGERVGWRRWSAIAVGLAGTVIVLRPSARGVLTLGGVAVLASASAYALSAIVVRVLGRTDSTQSMVFWMLALLGLFATALAWPDWIVLRREDAGVLIALGITGAIGQWGITEAFRRTPAAIVAPFEYTALIWGMALDWLLWGALPDRRMLVGAVVIVGAGLYLLRREPARTDAACGLP